MMDDKELDAMQSRIAALEAQLATARSFFGDDEDFDDEIAKVKARARADAIRGALSLASIVVHSDRPEWANLGAWAHAVEIYSMRIYALLDTPAPDPVAQAAVDPDAIEKDGKRWHGEDHRVVFVRWEPYKPDGQRQMKAKGRWQEQVGSGDYWRWQNCDRPVALRALAGEGKA
jgi:hypothetical protein